MDFPSCAWGSTGNVTEFPDLVTDGFYDHDDGGLFHRLHPVGTAE
jgi:hypothetical protein